MSIVIVNYTIRARKDLRALDAYIANRITAKVLEYTEAENVLVEAKRLSGIYAGLYRYRVGDYRVIFDMDSKGVVSILTVLRVKHRKDVYK